MPRVDSRVFLPSPLRSEMAQGDVDLYESGRVFPTERRGPSPRPCLYAEESVAVQVFDPQTTETNSTVP